jgi:UTP--glucose-1-phosphate uridylyltransferase
MFEHRFPETRVFVDTMAQVGAREEVIELFCEQYERYRAGETGKLPWSQIEEPRPDEIIDTALLGRGEYEPAGQALLDRLACIKLNGGLGTTMALERAKSLISVRDGCSFLGLVIEQISILRRRYGCRTPLVLMNSGRTRADCLPALHARGFTNEDVELDFLQHEVPRIDRSTNLPLRFAEVSESWAPAGHGDIYLALRTSGMLQRLLDTGYRWAYVSNMDNLAATVDPVLLGFLDQNNYDFAMEVTDKTAADIKGGTLIHYRGRPMLLERSQVEAGHLSDFEDLNRFSVFNTNSLWWRIDTLSSLLDGGGLGLPLIVNPKRIGETDLVQLETAMGAAIARFARSVGVRVPRQRFAPVKDTSDLLGIRSDAYVVDDRGGIRLSAQRTADWGPPRIALDGHFYAPLDRFERRFAGPLGLKNCRSLRVMGDVRFGRNVALYGDVIVRNTSARQVAIEDGSLLQGKVCF